MHGPGEVISAQKLQVVHPGVLVVEDEGHSREQVEDEGGSDVVAGDSLEFVFLATLLLIRGQEAENDIDYPDTINDLFQGPCIFLQDVHDVFAAGSISQSLKLGQSDLKIFRLDQTPDRSAWW